MLQAVGELFGNFADGVALVASMRFRVAKDADVSATAGAEQLQLLMVLDTLQRGQAVSSVSVLGAAGIAQGLVTIAASRRRPLELSVVALFAADLTQRLGGLEQVGDLVLQGVVDG